MRLDKFVSQQSGLSRKAARQAIRDGEVCVDGNCVSDPAWTLQPSLQQVKLASTPLSSPAPLYFMLHKPAGYVCSHQDPAHTSVFRLIANVEPARLHTAGRLDVDTTGLVLITDDGQWSHRLTSPRHAHEKEYIVGLSEPLSAAATEQLRNGVMLHQETEPTRPAVVTLLAPDQLQLIITEGRYHQVKRMLAAVGNHVVSLHRARVGQIRLDPTLAPGESRALTAAEIESI